MKCMSYSDYCREWWSVKILDKLLWFILWPIVLAGWILDTRVHLTKLPKRLELKDSCFVQFVIEQWFRKRRLEWRYYKGTTTCDTEPYKEFENASN